MIKLGLIIIGLILFSVFVTGLVDEIFSQQEKKFNKEKEDFEEHLRSHDKQRK